jgi:hypothetical protein
MENTTDSPRALSASDLFGAWVLCSDMLPEDGRDVLVVSKNGKRCVMYRDRGVWVHGIVTAGWHPTHWATLPLSPNTKPMEG